ncbi:hypothetical protein R3P38DRAFT_3196395 [Favolaschia claudopus]|uniref:F-box domain-containing protein n=1 Tax=Favolaschia claudopus TaxID=2862362 RepID=A0AAW0B8F4_9AGAR
MPLLFGVVLCRTAEAVAMSEGSRTEPSFFQRSELLMTFETLDVDVLPSILCLTDVYTVLSISRVSKYLHEISCSKAVWLSLVRRLYKRHVLVLPINALETVSVDELKDAVKRVVILPFNR